MFWCFLSQQLLKCELEQNAWFVIHDFHPSILRRTFFLARLLFNFWSVFACYMFQKKKLVKGPSNELFFILFFATPSNYECRWGLGQITFENVRFMCVLLLTLWLPHQRWAFFRHEPVHNTQAGVLICPLVANPQFPFRNMRGCYLLNLVWGPIDVYMKDPTKGCSVHVHDLCVVW